MNPHTGEFISDELEVKRTEGELGIRLPRFKVGQRFTAMGHRWEISAIHENSMEMRLVTQEEKRIERNRRKGKKRK